MAVYVDKLLFKGRGYFDGCYCRMFADDLEELHEMAAKIGGDTWTLQTAPRPRHYLVTKGPRARALATGAVELDQCQAAAKFRDLRGQ